jgi:DNA topoisomerase-1
MLETPHAQDTVFNKNFFEDWKKVMKDYPPVRIFQIYTFTC